jgi:hypothetical protein
MDSAHNVPQRSHVNHKCKIDRIAPLAGQDYNPHSALQIL